MPHVRRERQFSRVLKFRSIFSLSLLQLVIFLYFPYLSGRYTQDKERETYGSLQHHISIHFYETACSKQRNICFTRSIFRIRNFHQLISVYELTTRVAKCMRYYRLSIVLKIINYKVKFFRILNASTTSYSIFELPEYMYLYI